MHWFSDYPMSHGIGGVFMIFFWGLIIFIVVYLIKQGGRREKETAEDILKKRYARGEIQKEEFDRMKKELKESITSIWSGMRYWGMKRSSFSRTATMSM